MYRTTIPTRRTTIATLGASLLAMSLSSQLRAQQIGHPHQALTPEQKQQQAFQMLGSRMFIELDSDKTNDAVAVYRAWSPPKYGPPPHVHSREDEIFIIVKGHYRFRHGDEEVDAAPGAVLFMPRNVPHVFRVIGDEPGEHITILLPGGLEKMFREISAARLEVPRDIARLGEISAKYGIKNMPPGSMTLSDRR